MKLRITEAKLKEMDELMPLGKTDLGDLWDMRQDWVEMKKEVDRLKKQLQASRDSVYGISCEADEARFERRELREENERLKSEVRPEVKWFAAQMEQKLKENDHKQHWSCFHIDYLANRLCQEVGELWEAIKLGDEHEIVKESADVANFAMMIADNSEQAIQRIKGEGTSQ